MLESNKLYQSITQSIYNKIQHQIVQQLIVNQIKQFIKYNLQVSGNYTGILPIGSPDPFTGIITFKMISCQINYYSVLKASYKELNTWYKQICNQIKLMTLVNINSGNVGIYTPIKIFSQLSPSQINLQNIKDFNQSWNIVTKTLINDIKRSIPATLPISAFSTAGGNGIINFSKFI